MNNKLQVLGIAGMLAAMPVFAAPTLFEDFSGETVNMDKYWGMEESIRLDRNQQNLRFMAGGRGYAHKSRASNLRLQDNSASLFQADLTLSEVSLSNPDTQQAILAVAGIYYNSESANPQNDLGEVFVRVAVGDRGNGPEAWYEMQVSEASDWSAGSITEASLGPVELDTAYTASITYDGDNSFTVRFDNGEAIAFDGPPRMGPPFDPLRYLNNRIRFGQDNSTPSLYDEMPDIGEPATIVGRADNVVTENGLIDDFSGNDIDQATWIEDQTTVQVLDEALVIKVTGQGDQETERFWIRQKGLKTFGATLTLLGNSTVNDTTRPRGRITHFLGNDTYDVENGDQPNGWEGFLWTQFLIERAGGRSRAVVYAERVADADWIGTDELFWEEVATIQMDRPYDLLIEQDGSVVRYSLDGEVVKEIDLATDFDGILSGDVFEAVGDTESGLQARVQNAAGRAHVRFDDIVTDLVPPSLSLNAFDADDNEIEYPASVKAHEGEIIDLAADVSEPSRVESYLWQQVAGADVEIVEGRFAGRAVGTDATLSFKVPAGTDSQTLEFKVTVVDNAGFEAEQSFAVEVDNSATSTLTRQPGTRASNSKKSGGGAFASALPVFAWLLWLVVARAKRRAA